jgi:hypothetical protein
VLARVVSSVLVLVEAGEVPSTRPTPERSQVRTLCWRDHAATYLLTRGEPRAALGPRTNAPTRSSAATPNGSTSPMLLLLRAERRAAPRRPPGSSQRPRPRSAGRSAGTPHDKHRCRATRTDHLGSLARPVSRKGKCICEARRQVEARAPARAGKSAVDSPCKGWRVTKRSGAASVTGCTG